VPDPVEGNGAASRPLEWLEEASGAIEAVTTIFAAASTVVAFVSANGGIVAVLAEIGVFGFACYVGVIPAMVLLLVVGEGLQRLEMAAHRKTKDSVAIGVSIVIALGVAIVIRLVVFAPGLTDDLDTFGQAFTASVGVVVLLIPLLGYWYFYGSAPQQDAP
jgi:hypothetical protein